MVISCFQSRLKPELHCVMPLAICHRDMFVVQASGRSMEPKIHDGDLCVMRKYAGGSRQGKIMLAQHRETYDPDTGGAYSIKKYSSEKVVLADGTWRHEKITLSPLNLEFKLIE